MTRGERRLLAEVENSPFAWEVREFVRERGRYEGPATWILTNLNERAAETSKTAKEWPKTPNQVGKLLKKLTPSLELKGMKVSYSRHGVYGRLWLLEDENYTEPKFLPAPGRHSSNQLISASRATIRAVTP
jgi:hypothetical protein